MKLLWNREINNAFIMNPLDKQSINKTDYGFELNSCKLNVYIFNFK